MGFCSASLFCCCGLGIRRDGVANVLQVKSSPFLVVPGSRERVLEWQDIEGAEGKLRKSRLDVDWSGKEKNVGNYLLRN